MRRQALLLIGLAALGVLFSSGCKPLRKKVEVPAPPPVEIAHTGPATELENQATSTPVPKPAPLPPSKPMAEPSPSTEPKSAPAPPPVVKTQPPPPKVPARKRARVSPPSEPVSPPPAAPAAAPATAAPLQLEPLTSQTERDELKQKIEQELKSARGLLERIKGRKLPNELNSYPATIADFIAKAEAAQQRGDFRQSLAMAEKANTLAKSLAKP